MAGGSCEGEHRRCFASCPAQKGFVWIYPPGGQLDFPLNKTLEENDTGRGFVRITTASASCQLYPYCNIASRTCHGELVVSWPPIIHKEGVLVHGLHEDKLSGSGDGEVIIVDHVEMRRN